MSLPFHFSASQRIFLNAKKLRKEQTAAEPMLWGLLRNRKLEGRKFRRQHPISGYILDFYCHECNLAIEIDGSGHETEVGKAYDEERTEYLESLGLRVIRFKNEQVLNNVNAVLAAIRTYL